MVLPVSNGASPTPPYSGFPPRFAHYLYGTLTPYGWLFHAIPVLIDLIMQVLQPPRCRNTLGLGLFPFARHYLGNHYCFLFLQVLRCFSSLGSPPRKGTMSSTWWVAPFGNLRINSHVPIPEAYRSLSRPSSPLRA